jgi:hypothetical protein
VTCPSHREKMKFLSSAWRRIYSERRQSAQRRGEAISIQTRCQRCARRGEAQDQAQPGMHVELR